MMRAPLENLRALSREGTVLEEKRLYELSELAYFIYREIKEGSIPLSSPYAFCDAVSLRLKMKVGEAADSALYKAFLENASSVSHYTDLAAFSVFLAGELSAKSFSPFSERMGRRKNARIAYVRASVADGAYEKISHSIKDASVLYVGSAEEACAAVAAAEADFALLPVSYGQGERLFTVERLTERYKMFINSTVRMPLSDEKEAHFGLFSLSPEPAVASQKRELALRLTADSLESLFKLVGLCPLFGYTLKDFALTPSEYERASARAVFGGEGNDRALWFFLSLSSCDFTLLGSYYQL